MLDLQWAGAGEIAAEIRAGRLTAAEACAAAIARIQDLDGPINAVPVRDFDRARAAAAAIDASRAPDDRRPLLGVPMTVKESNDVAGLPSTWGFESFRDHAAEEDAVVIARLKAAGAVILGKTNAPVALADWQSENPIYGRTVHPLDPTRTPGGSSGGAAAALAAGMTPLEIGSDIGGSIRVPAHFCGVFGHKPTYGLISSLGHGVPGADSAEAPLAVVGPMARSAGDLALAMEVIAGPAEPGLAWTAPPMRAGALAEARILILTAHPLARVAGEVTALQRGLAEALANAGAVVEDAAAISLPDLEAAHRDYVKMLTTVITWGVEGATPITAHEWLDLQSAQFRLARAWKAIFAEWDALIAPTFGLPAFPHQSEPEWRDRRLMIDGEETPFGDQLVWPGLATFPGLPATAVPVGKSSEGLPIGLQILAAPYADKTTIGLAQMMEGAGMLAA